MQPEKPAADVPKAGPEQAAAENNHVAAAEKLDDAVALGQEAIDTVDEASMESFPASDPPGYTMCHV